MQPYCFGCEDRVHDGAFRDGGVRGSLKDFPAPLTRESAVWIVLVLEGK
jgi:hypothetical protein